MGVYWALADYGRSFARPAIWLAASVWLFHLGYSAILAPLMQQAGEVNADKYARAEWMVALGNAVPFVGPLTIDAEIKKFLFCPGFGPCLPIPPEGFQLLVIGQNLLSIILRVFHRPCVAQLFQDQVTGCRVFQTLQPAAVPHDRW